MAKIKSISLNGVVYDIAGGATLGNGLECPVVLVVHATGDYRFPQTVANIAKCYEAGARGVELDFYPCSDGTVFFNHTYTNIANKTSSQLIAQGYSSIDDVFDYCRRHNMYIHPDIKGLNYYSTWADYARYLAEKALRYNMQNHILWESVIGQHSSVLPVLEEHFGSVYTGKGLAEANFNADGIINARKNHKPVYAYPTSQPYSDDTVKAGFDLYPDFLEVYTPEQAEMLLDRWSGVTD